MARVMISYASGRDEPNARALKLALANLGIAAWIAAEDVPAGLDYAACVETAIERASAVVLMVAPEAFASDQVKREIDLAVAHHRLILPLYRGGSVPALPKEQGWVYRLGLVQMRPYTSISQAAEIVAGSLRPATARADPRESGTSPGGPTPPQAHDEEVASWQVEPLPQPLSRGGPICLATVSAEPGHVEWFVATESGRLVHFVHASPWEWVPQDPSEAPPFGDPVRSITACRGPQDSASAFALSRGGALARSTLGPRGWSDWNTLPTPGPLATVSSCYSDDGQIELVALTVGHLLRSLRIGP